jgi:hypothetical protein
MTTTATAPGTAHARTQEPTVLLPSENRPGDVTGCQALKAGVLAAPEDGGPCVWIDLGDGDISSSCMRDADRVRKFASDLRVFATAVEAIADELAELQA